MKAGSKRFAIVVIGALLLAVVAGARAQAAPAEPLAEVNGVPITAKDVERSLGAKLSQLEEQIYTLKRNEVDALVAQRLLAQEAAKRGVSVAALLDDEVTSKVALVTEKEIDDYYKAYSAAFDGRRTTANSWIDKGNAALKKQAAQVKIINAEIKAIDAATDKLVADMAALDESISKTTSLCQAAGS